METLREQLNEVIAEACRHPIGSPSRQKYLTQIIRLIANKLWKENTPYYEDALQQTWIYFCNNLCESKTCKAYDPEQASVITWLNAYLKRRLQDFRLENQKQQTQIKQITEVDASSLVEQQSAKPDIPPMLDEIKKWVETDEHNQLSQISLRDHPNITCQMLILRRLPPETPWKTLSCEWGVSTSTLSSFYQRRCLPCLREFGRSQGYL
ncbi:sigma-70 family RNA polymerase sigma factor [Chroococcus sp. FPU101]|uniref:sigma-70 family RNA polymerase sigma factor n=1 Tax=Chroococcus sp. FPU101 TaxID=1974212 RepID=UPI001A8CDD53|nr:sigma-70 family RNA polymerase sigma factor [Chroococcus sp. FPU101]GFE69293.1 hypothetical protein CFPU101_19030 [Chroococcus sp. FPU101]